MKSPGRLFLREIRQAKWQFLALVAIIGIGTFFYAGLTAISGSLGAYVETYYRDFNLSDAIVHFDSLPATAVQSFAQIEGVDQAEARQVMEMKVSGSEPQAKLLVHTIPFGNEINRCALVEGREPGAKEVLIDSFFAKANQLSIRDPICLTNQTTALTLSISGFCENVEHSYNIEDPSMVLPDRKTYGIAYLAEDTLGQTDYNQLLIDLEDGFAISDVLPRIEATALSHAYRYTTPRESLTGYQAIRTTIENNKVMSWVTPLVLFTISSIVILISLSRLVDSQRRQIGIMKALGISRKSILCHYMCYPIVSTFLGVTLGFGFAYFIFRPILDDIGHQTYSLPGYQVSLSLSAILPPLALSLLFGSLACCLSLRRTLTANAMELMKPKTLKSSNRLALENVPQIWNRLSFTCKLMLRNLSINKLKLVAGSLGMMVCVVLLVTAFGFQASMQQMMQRTKDMYSYDLLVQYKGEAAGEIMPGQAAEVFPLTQLNLQLADYEKAHFKLLALDPHAGHFHHFDQDHQTLHLTDTGVIIPQSFAEHHGISPGQEIQAVLLLSDGATQAVRLHVAQLSAQYTAPKFFVSEHYLNKIVSGITQNGATIRLAQGDVDAAQKQLLGRPDVLSVETREDIQLRISNLIKQNNLVFSIFILVAIVLSFCAIYTVSTISIQERLRELATLKVLGFSRNKLYRLVFNENYLITTVAILFALPFCVLSYGRVVNALRASGQLIPNRLHGLTILAGIGITVLLTVMTNQLLKRPIRQIDLAKSSKQFE